MRQMTSWKHCSIYLWLSKILVVPTGYITVQINMSIKMILQMTWVPKLLGGSSHNRSWLITLVSKSLLPEMNYPIRGWTAPSCKPAVSWQVPSDFPYFSPWIPCWWIHPIVTSLTSIPFYSIIPIFFQDRIREIRCILTIIHHNSIIYHHTFHGMGMGYFN